MVKDIIFYDSSGIEIRSLAQWDEDVYVYFYEPEITPSPLVHFCNSKSDIAYVVETSYENGKYKAKIPNILLRQPYRIMGYVYMEYDGGKRSIFRANINLISRPKPDDLVFQDSSDYVSVTTVLYECRDLADQVQQNLNSANNAATNASNSASAAQNAAREAQTYVENLQDGIGDEVRNVLDSQVTEMVNTKVAEQINIALSEQQQIHVAQNTRLDGVEASLAEQQKINTNQNYRLDNLEAAAQGYLYREAVDAAEAYEKAVPADAMKWATLDQIGGKTLVWNQMIHALNNTEFNPYFANNIKVEFSDDQADIEYLVSGKGYGHALMYRATDLNWITGHKYYVSYFANPSADSDLNLEIFSNGALTPPKKCIANKWTLNDWIVSNESTPAGRPIYFVRNDQVQNAGYKIIIKNPMVFDLTAMFGAGNEPSTPEEFRALFPADYYPYSEPTLMNFSNSAVVSSTGQVLDTSAIVRKYFPGGMKSAGTVHDEIDSERMVAIQRVGSVDLGTFTWVKYRLSETQLVYWTMLTGRKLGFNNMVTSKYVTGSKAASVQNPDKSIIGSETSTQILVNDNGYSDASAFQAAMQGVMLYYELAAPIETPITEAFDPSIEVESGGTLTFENDQGENFRVPVTNQETFMIKLPGGVSE